MLSGVLGAVSGGVWGHGYGGVEGGCCFLPGGDLYGLSVVGVVGGWDGVCLDGAGGVHFDVVLELAGDGEG
jgi:hypothetical protein